MKHRNRVAVWAWALMLWVCQLAPLRAQDTRGVGRVEVTVKPRRNAAQGQRVTLYQGSYALLLGNSDYQNNAAWDDLPGVREDLPAVGKALQAQGFVVETAYNLTRATFQKRVDEFISQYGQEYENRLLIYYAGHGYTARLADNRRMGYLVMKDAPEMPPVEKALEKTPANLSQFRLTAIAMDEMQTYATGIAAKHALFVFDSCFSGSVLYREGAVNVPEYIGPEVTEAVRAFLTAGSEKQRVRDDSPFRRALVRGLGGAADSDGDGYVLSTELAGYVKKEVARATNGEQTPVFGKIRNQPELERGDMVFVLAQSSGGNTEVARSDENAICQRLANSREESELQAYLDAFGEGGQCTAKVKYNLALARLTAKATVIPPPVPRITPTPTPAPAVLAAGTQRGFALKAGLTAQFRWIPAGKFTMGEGSQAQEVSISQGFWMGETEVTQGQWKAVMGGLPARCDRGSVQAAGIGDDLPIVCVSWEDVQQFIGKLNNLNDGYEYALPSNMQWEYAAWKGTTTQYYWGDYVTEICRYANIADQAAKRTYKDWSVTECDDGYAELAPVGKFPATGCGLRDMAGNVKEWVADIYGSFRGYQGGSWDDNGAEVLPRIRINFNAGDRRDSLGFRLARTPV